MWTFTYLATAKNKRLDACTGEFAHQLSLFLCHYHRVDIQNFSKLSKIFHYLPSSCALIA